MTRDEEVAEQNGHEEAILQERFRCLALCDGWINNFKDREIKYVGAREYAIDAIRDIIDLISDGQEVGRCKPATEDASEPSTLTMGNASDPAQ